MIDDDGILEMIDVERRGGVVRIWLARPDRLNAQTLRMWQELARLGESLCADDSVRAVVISSRWRSFSSGIDLAELSGTVRLRSSQEERRYIGRAAQRSTMWLAWRLFRRSPPCEAMPTAQG